MHVWIECRFGGAKQLFPDVGQLDKIFNRVMQISHVSIVKMFRIFVLWLK
jgi:hypothetical protein